MHRFFREDRPSASIFGPSMPGPCRYLQQFLRSVAYHNQYFTGNGVMQHSERGTYNRSPVPVVHQLLQLLQHLLHLWNCASAVNELANLWMSQLIGCDERQEGNGLAGACWHLRRDKPLSSLNDLCTRILPAVPAERAPASWRQPCSPPGDNVLWRPEHV